MNNSYYSIKQNHLFTGRGATAIYLCLYNEGIKDSLVVVPGNICYAAIFPVIASGNRPYFCDVDPDDGNISMAILDKISDSSIKAIILPHMYGNYVKDIKAIKKWCEKAGIILIEDCASSLGSRDDKGNISGLNGDYVIYSFGHSKILDLGNGGLLISDRNLDKAKEKLEELPLFNKKIEIKEEAFSKEYRNVRYIHNDYSYIKTLLEDDLFLYRSDNTCIEENYQNEDLINKAIKMHQDNYVLYDNLIDKKYHRYRYYKGSVPWRFSLMIEKKQKKKIIDNLLKNSCPVSDWYPNITEMFMDKKLNLPGVDEMEELIINFPLDIDEEKIRNICFNINVTGDE